MEFTQQELLRDNKLNYKELSKYKGAIQRFAHYRELPIDIVPDIDRSSDVLKKFEKLEWITSSCHGFLEPDTYLCSPWVLLKRLLLASDSKFYIQDFKEYVIDMQEDYEKSNNAHLKHLRFKWLTLNTTQVHYKEVYESEVVNDLLNLSHALPNLNVIPYKMGATKCIVYGEDPFATLMDLEINFDDYKENFALVGIENFSSYIDRYCFNCCYETNSQGELSIKKSLKNIYTFHSEDTFDSIIKKCKLLVELVKARSSEIENTYKMQSTIC